MTRKVLKTSYSNLLSKMQVILVDYSPISALYNPKPGSNNSGLKQMLKVVVYDLLKANSI